MTPRQLFAWDRAIFAECRIETASDLYVSALGSRGEPKEVAKQLRLLSRP